MTKKENTIIYNNMDKDLKNVIITFGLVAIFFMQGFFSYQNKIQREFITTVIKDELQKIKNEETALMEKYIREQLVKTESTKITQKPKIQPSTNSQQQVAANDQKTQTLADQQAAAQAQADQQAAQVRAQALADQQAAAQAAAQQKVANQSRQSAAS